jgi:putative ABC transport system substrate-binding protein
LFSLEKMSAIVTRRTLLVALAAGAAYHWSPPLLAQSLQRLPRVAIIEPGGPVENIAIGGVARWDAFLRQLESLGHVEGRTFRIERWSGLVQTDEGAAQLARSVVETMPDVIVVPGLRLIGAARTATARIPIVGMGAFPDDINRGHPGGNVTGVEGVDIYAKVVQLLQETLLGADELAWLGVPDSWTGQIGLAMRAGANALGISVKPYFLDSSLSEQNIREVMRRMAEEGPRGLLVHPLQALLNFAPLVAQLALEARLPAIALHPSYVEAGLLMTYGPDEIEFHRRWAVYVDRILDGANPGAIPIEQPTEFDLIVNMRTAKALGIALPPTVMISVTKVIE